MNSSSKYETMLEGKEPDMEGQYDDMGTSQSKSYTTH